jgi:hypothetical protein
MCFLQQCTEILRTKLFIQPREQPKNLKPTHTIMGWDTEAIRLHKLSKDLLRTTIGSSTV